MNCIDSSPFLAEGSDDDTSSTMQIFLKGWQCSWPHEMLLISRTKESLFETITDKRVADALGSPTKSQNLMQSKQTLSCPLRSLMHYFITFCVNVALKRFCFDVQVRCIIRKLDVLDERGYGVLMTLLLSCSCED